MTPRNNVVHHELLSNYYMGIMKMVPKVNYVFWQHPGKDNKCLVSASWDSK